MPVSHSLFYIVIVPPLQSASGSISSEISRPSPCPLRVKASKNASLKTCNSTVVPSPPPPTGTCYSDVAVGTSDKDSVTSPHQHAVESFSVSIPGGDVHFIPASYVRPAAVVVSEMVIAYANFLNIPSVELEIWECNLAPLLLELRAEFSTFGFHERVLNDAADFVFPDDMYSRDLSEYREADSSLESMAAIRRMTKADDRFNPVRCNALFSEAPEFDRLLSLARDGVIIDVPSDLVLRTIPEPPRKLERKLQPVYWKHAYKVWAKKDAIVLPISHLSSSDASSIHFNSSHLTHKPGGSRYLMDCSNSESGHVLNTPEVKELVIARYGPVVYCTIQSIVTSWYNYADALHVPLSACRLFKEDFSGAFAQLDICPQSVRFLALSIGCGLVLTYIVGLFGLLGFPMAFGVLSRAFEWLLRRDLDIPLSLYVDDIIALSLAERAESDQLYIETKCLQGMGSTAINFEKKLFPSVSGEVLGWSVCLCSETFRPSDKGIRKLIFAFWVVASGDVFPLVVYQMLGSLSDHYSLGVPGMKPFSRAFHDMTARFGSGSGRIYYQKAPTSAARMSIEVWRVASLLLWQKNTYVCRPLRCLVTLGPANCHLSVFTDSSPWGIGIGIYHANGSLAYYLGYKFPFAESPFQNAREYFGFMLSFFFLSWVSDCPAKGLEVSWVGDNESALSWATKNKCNSLAAQYAFLVVTWLQLTSLISFSSISHQPGIIMGDIDSLSRGLPHSLDPNKKYVPTESQSIQLDALFCLLDPSIVRNLEDHHLAFSTVVSMARDLLSPSFRR